MPSTRLLVLLPLAALACSDPNRGSGGDGNGAPDGGGPAPDGGGVVVLGAVGDPCASNDDCADATCITGLPGGYCTLAGCGDALACPEGAECFDVQDETLGSACFKTCAASTECRTGEGYICDGDKTCYPGEETGTVGPGGACASSDVCLGGGECYPETSRNEPTGFVGGYCMIWDCTAASCPAGSSCYTLRATSGDVNICLATCTEASECRKGYACAQIREAMPSACWPDCATDSDCPDGYACEAADPSDRYCRSTAGDCSPSNTSGKCAAGNVCNAGVCEPFQCNDTRNEPNETFAAATPVAPGSDTGLALCAADKDWYSLAIPPHTIGRLGIAYQKDSGDLDLTAYRPDGACQGGRLMQQSVYSGSCPGTVRDYETGEEHLSAFNGGDTGDVAWAWQVAGYKGAVNLYSVVRTLVPYTDGRDCGAPYTDCTGRDSAGRTSLIQFPYPDPNDPYVGDGWRFDSAANYRWLRREVIMLVRYALKETQDKFPGTKPLGLIDMAQRDGVTPGYDVNDPRHPESTHDQGGNIDIAYYTTLASNGSLPYNEARIICDANEGSVLSGAYCKATSATTHVVDLPRQVYFMAKLFESSRVRVIGADRVIGPLLVQEAARQEGLGWITTAQKNSFSTRLAYDEMNCESTNDCGWPYHHHHIHVSFKWWGQARSGGTTPRDGCGFDLLKHRAR